MYVCMYVCLYARTYVRTYVRMCKVQTRAPKAASETDAEGREKEPACICAKYKRQEKPSPV